MNTDICERKIKIIHEGCGSSVDIHCCRMLENLQILLGIFCRRCDGPFVFDHAEASNQCIIYFSTKCISYIK